MSLFRKSLIIALAGLIVGLAGGTGFAYWRRISSGSIYTPANDTLTLRCTGDGSPAIVVTWPAKVTSLMGGLQRSVGTGPWESLYAAGSEPKATGYRDTSVTLGNDYHYRVRLFINAPYISTTIHADAATCTPL